MVRIPPPFTLCNFLSFIIVIFSPVKVSQDQSVKKSMIKIQVVVDVVISPLVLPSDWKRTLV